MHNQEKCPHCGEVITDLDDYNWRRHELVNTLPRNPERTVALRKLLEAKDAAVRAVLAK